MAEIINGKELAKEIRLSLKEKVEKEKLSPKLAVILCGDNEASKVYVRNKSKACDEVGIEYEEFLLPSTTTQKELLDLIDRLNFTSKSNSKGP